MLQIIETIVYFVIIPAIYLSMFLFYFYLLSNQSIPQQSKLRTLFGILAGGLIAGVFLLLDTDTSLLKAVNSMPSTITPSETLPYIAIGFIIGLLLMPAVKAILQSEISLSFVAMWSTFIMIMLSFFLETLQPFRSIIAVSIFGTVAGTVTYFC